MIMIAVCAHECSRLADGPGRLCRREEGGNHYRPLRQHLRTPVHTLVPSPQDAATAYEMSAMALEEHFALMAWGYKEFERHCMEVEDQVAVALRSVEQIVAGARPRNDILVESIVLMREHAYLLANDMENKQAPP